MAGDVLGDVLGDVVGDVAGRHSDGAGDEPAGDVGGSPTAYGAAAGEDRVEVRLLSPVPVRRADGTRVPDREWRTAKTLDLVRRLAVRSPHAVAVDDLVGTFWPAADPERARASLRTAVSQVRRVLGADVVERRLTGLALSGVWVDVTAFRTLADQAARAARAGADGEALLAAREALALHVEPLRAADDEADWVRTERQELEHVRFDLLLTGSEAALRQGWAADALALGRLAVAADPLSERACRALARALNALGERDGALRELDRCRREVADSTGADLSAQTRSLHLEVLRGTDPGGGEREVAHVARGREVRLLREVLDRPGGPHVVVLEGPGGSGRRRLVRESAGRREVVVLEDDGEAVDAGSPAPTPPGGVVVVPRRRRSTDRLLEDVLRGRAPGGPPAAVVVLTEPGAEPGAESAGPTSPPVALHLVLHGLTPEDVADLAGRVLAGPPSRALVADLLRSSGGRAGEVVRLTRRWLREGQVVSTSTGLVRVGEASVEGPTATALPGDVVGLLSEAELEVLQLAAVLDAPLTAESLTPLLVAGPPGSARTSLSALVEHQLFRVDARGWTWKHPHLRDAVRCWMRPLARTALARRLAERAGVDTATRTALWLEAGEREMACAAALDGAAEATASGDWASARSALLDVLAIRGPAVSTPVDRVQLLERLADTCVLLHRVDEARAALQTASDTAAAAGLPGAGRLRDKLSAVAEVDAAPGHDGRLVSTVFAPATPSAPSSTPSSGPALPPRAELLIAPPARLQADLDRLVQEADRSGDTALAIDTTFEACRLVHLPTRDFRTCRREAREVFTRSADPLVRQRALFWENLPDVLLGGAARLLEAVETAAGEARGLAHDPTRDHFSLLRLLVHHDLGHPGASALLDEHEAAVLATPGADAVEGRAEVCARIAVERGELDRAHRLLAAGPRPDTTHSTRQLRGLVRASLLRQTGRAAQAEERLLQELAAVERTGCTLFVPEVVAKLVLLTADRDLPRALDLFDRWDRVLDDGTSMPRETVLRLLARAAVRRAAGADDRAAASRAAATLAAREAGLVHLPTSVWGGRARPAHPGNDGAGAHPEVDTRSAIRSG